MCFEIILMNAFVYHLKLNIDRIDEHVRVLDVLVRGKIQKKLYSENALDLHY